MKMCLYVLSPIGLVMFHFRRGDPIRRSSVNLKPYAIQALGSRVEGLELTVWGL